MIYVSFGIDVEGVHGNDPFDDMILCKKKGSFGKTKFFGATFMAKLFAEYGFEATFFLDTFERLMHGENKMKELCDELKKLKQDIQLHTHPSWRFDPRDSIKLNKLKKKIFPRQDKDFMYKLTEDEQYEFIKTEKQILENWIDKKVTVHRAGGYGIDKNTFKIGRADV